MATTLVSQGKAEDYIVYLDMTGTDDTDNTGTCLIQATDAAGNSLAERVLVHVWIADADFSEPDAQTDLSILTGEQLYETEANADYTVISNASGLVNMNIDAGGAKTVYVMAMCGGRIYSEQIDITSA